MNSIEFPELYFRETEIDGVGPWLWIRSDNGAWDGPTQDWMTSHRDKYLKHCKNKRTVICAGGNLGLYPRLLSNHFQRVIAFEPDAFNFHCMVNNCAKKNIIKINAALGSVHECVGMKLNEGFNNVGMHQVDGEGIIPSMVLDDFDLPDVDLLQFDMEGYEFHAVTGAINTIIRCKPVISVECPCDVLRQELLALGYQQVDQSVSDSIFAIL